MHENFRWDKFKWWNISLIFSCENYRLRTQGLPKSSNNDHRGISIATFLFEIWDIISSFTFTFIIKLCWNQNHNENFYPMESSILPVANPRKHDEFITHSAHFWIFRNCTCIPFFLFGWRKYSQRRMHKRKKKIIDVFLF